MFQIPFVILMATLNGRDGPAGRGKALIVSAIMLFVVVYPIFLISNEELSNSNYEKVSRTNSNDPWSDGDQPWPQPGRTPDRGSGSPAHDPVGVNNSLISITDPVINWEYGVAMI